jgi:hypothetical protein
VAFPALRPGISRTALALGIRMRAYLPLAVGMRISGSAAGAPSRNRTSLTNAFTIPAVPMRTTAMATMQRSDGGGAGSALPLARRLMNDHASAIETHANPRPKRSSSSPEACARAAGWASGTSAGWLLLKGPTRAVRSRRRRTSRLLVHRRASGVDAHAHRRRAPGSTSRAAWSLAFSAVIRAAPRRLTRPRSTRG